MANILFRNNASGTLAAGINPGDTSLTLDSGQGSLFPSPTGTEYAKMALEDVGGNIEIVHLTLRAGDVLTVVRAQEGTSALAFASGSRCELRATSAVYQEFLQRAGDTLPGTYDMTGGTIDGGTYQDGEVVNSPMRGDSGVTTNQIAVPPGGGPPTIGGSLIYTAANLTAAVASALVFSTGMVMLWHGTLGSIPAGWQICDGTGGTPDLRDKFVIGAGSTYAWQDTGGAASVTSGAGGTHLPVIQGTSLTLAETPVHSHRLYVWEGGLNPDNAFAFNAAPQAKALAGNDGGSGRTQAYRSTTTFGNKLVEDAGTGAAHSHNADTVPDHTHSVATLPPFVALFFIMRL
jgi:hypothetical protein